MKKGSFQHKDELEVVVSPGKPPQRRLSDHFSTTCSCSDGDAYMIKISQDKISSMRVVTRQIPTNLFSLEQKQEHEHGELESYCGEDLATGDDLSIISCELNDMIESCDRTTSGRRSLHDTSTASMPMLESYSNGSFYDSSHSIWGSSTDGSVNSFSHRLDLEDVQEDLDRRTQIKERMKSLTIEIKADDSNELRPVARSSPRARPKSRWDSSEHTRDSQPSQPQSEEQRKNTGKGQNEN